MKKERWAWRGRRRREKKKGAKKERNQIALAQSVNLHFQTRGKGWWWWSSGVADGDEWVEATFFSLFYSGGLFFFIICICRSQSKGLLNYVPLFSVKCVWGEDDQDKKIMATQGVWGQEALSTFTYLTVLAGEGGWGPFSLNWMSLGELLHYSL